MCIQKIIKDLGSELSKSLSFPKGIFIYAVRKYLLPGDKHSEKNVMFYMHNEGRTYTSEEFRELINQRRGIKSQAMRLEYLDLL